MSLTETMLEGTLQADGSLLLDRKPDLPPGRVTIVLRQDTKVNLPSDDPFWQRMQAIWDSQNVAGHVPRSADQIDADQHAMRFEWDARQDELEQIQAESRQVHQLSGESSP